jgi:hypothetical protein
MEEALHLVSMARDAQIVKGLFMVAVRSKTIPGKGSVEAVRDFLFSRAADDAMVKKIVEEASRFSAAPLPKEESLEEILDATTPPPRREELMSGIVRFFSDIERRCSFLQRYQ